MGVCTVATAVDVWPWFFLTAFCWMIASAVAYILADTQWWVHMWTKLGRAELGRRKKVRKIAYELVSAGFPLNEAQKAAERALTKAAEMDFPKEVTSPK